MKVNILADACSTTTENENKKSTNKEVTNKPTEMQLKSVCRKIFGALTEDAKIGE